MAQHAEATAKPSAFVIHRPPAGARTPNKRNANILPMIEDRLGKRPWRGTLSSDPRAPMKIIADYHNLCGECPIWDADAGILYWTDCAGRRFYRYDPRTAAHQIVKEGLEIVGYRINRS